MSAPLPTATVGDAMSDLPEIRNGHEGGDGWWRRTCVTFTVIGEPSVWLLTACEMSCSSVLKYKCVFLCYSYIESGENRCQLVLWDHMSKVIVPLTEAGITHIPTASGCDCCDLPNIVVRLSDGHSQRNSQLLLVQSVHSFVTLLSCSAAAVQTAVIVTSNSEHIIVHSFYCG